MKRKQTLLFAIITVIAVLFSSCTINFDYSDEAMAINYESYIKTLFARADGFVTEPKNLNRNYLHHGMSKRKVLRRDCIGCT